MTCTDTLQAYANLERVDLYVGAIARLYPTVRDPGVMLLLPAAAPPACPK